MRLPITMAIVLVSFLLHAGTQATAPSLPRLIIISWDGTADWVIDLGAAPKGLF